TPTVIDRVKFGKLALDGNRLISDSATPIKERARMHSNGLVLTSFVLNAKGKLLGNPQISMHGLVDDAEISGLSSELSAAAADFVESLPTAERDNDGVIEEGTITALRRVLKLRLGRRPIIDVHVMRV
ncbi:MAG: MBL fold metallo-hydrolase, partial [Alphaproteobacteria bacterium]|nr:MBL fold metallo-hydrolase [Alphaproteobacteria bacterium]